MKKGRGSSGCLYRPVMAALGSRVGAGLVSLSPPVVRTRPIGVRSGDEERTGGMRSRAAPRAFSDASARDWALGAAIGHNDLRQFMHDPVASTTHRPRRRPCRPPRRLRPTVGERRWSTRSMRWATSRPGGPRSGARHARTGSRSAPGSARHRVDEIRGCGMRLTTTKDLSSIFTGGAGNADHCARL